MILAIAFFLQILSAKSRQFPAISSLRQKIYISFYHKYQILSSTSTEMIFFSFMLLIYTNILLFKQSSVPKLNPTWLCVLSFLTSLDWVYFQTFASTSGRDWPETVFLLMVLCGLSVRVDPKKQAGKYLPLSRSLQDYVQHQCYFFPKCLPECIDGAIWIWNFFMEWLLIIYIRLFTFYALLE